MSCTNDCTNVTPQYWMLGHNTYSLSQLSSKSVHAVALITKGYLWHSSGLIWVSDSANLQPICKGREDQYEQYLKSLNLAPLLALKW